MAVVVAGAAALAAIGGVAVVRGSVDGSTPATVGASGAATTASSVAVAQTATPSATALASDAGPASFPVLPGQGATSRFTTVVVSPRGPAVTVTRPGGTWARHRIAVMWLSHVAIRLELHPGVHTSYSRVIDPGASPHWTTSPILSGLRLQRGLAATFNGGFKVTNGDAHGGYWDSGYGIDGRGRVVHDPSGAQVLHRGVMSLVMHRDGTWAMGLWGTQLRMTSTVRFVRQELTPLVDGGKVEPLTRARSCQAVWGKTVGGVGCAPWRSGVGVTSAGDLVYVSGAALTPYQLAVLLREAGAVRAMQLDVNSQWVSAEYYRPGTTTRAAVAHVLNSPYYRAGHYVSGSVAAGTASNRDFFAAYLR